ncbi:chloride channel protein [Paenarthrobacter sp. PH39-S1]|uniref:chloride channel protein n=1 Tax=Paenarthrobacter sp. PH39-S1 TaxID=3046204 RepID=UPI0024BBE714|nr:chloride channel protein [Paenarthrobacter sp. PH39-S1]MDJ0356877.1 chloride channel protein [Paenarthrobacter sp. PH39-S1]
MTALHSTGRRWFPGGRSVRTLQMRLGGTSYQWVAMAILVGAGAGLAAVAFRWLISAATLIFTGTADYSASHGHPGHPWAPWLGGFFVVLAPVVGGLLYGPLVERFAPEARGHGVPEVMYAVSQHGGRIKGRVALVKALASAICIGSGGSVGREGPIVQIGSALGSWLARVFRMPESRVRALVACGAAGGIAATFNAPIAGVFFALELILADFAAGSFGAVVLASVTASIIGRSFLGNEAFLKLPPFTITSAAEYPLFILLGLLAAIAGVGFTRILYLFEDLCDWAWRGPAWLRPAAGGVLLGLLLLVLPQMYGVGYPVMQAGVAGSYTVGFLVLLLVGKIVATSLTIGIGGSGGVFAPSLFIGAMLGAAFGEAAGLLSPALHGQVGAFALVGMGAVFAGAARAPITAVIIMFELTGEYSIILPLMLAIVVASGVSKVMSRDTIYTLKLRRRGIDLERHPGTELLSRTRVDAVMDTSFRSLPGHLSVAEGARRLLTAKHPALPVIGADGRLTGIVTVQHLANVLNDDDERDRVPLSDVVEMPATVLPEDTLQMVLDAVLGSSSNAGLPVTDADGSLHGWLNQESVLRILSRTNALPASGPEQRPGSPRPSAQPRPRTGSGGKRTLVRRKFQRAPRAQPNNDHRSGADLNNRASPSQRQHAGTARTERPQVHTNGGTFLVFPDGHVVTVTNEKYEQGCRALARVAFADPRPAAMDQATEDFRRTEEECFLEFGLIRHGNEWVFAEQSGP